MGNRYYDGPVSDHFDGTRFFHPGLPAADKSLWDVLRWRVLGRRTRWPKRVPGREGICPEARVDGLRITLVGHSSLLVQAAGVNVLVDPVWSERASPFGWAGPRRHNPPAIAMRDLPPIDAVLLTHNHYDHMDVGSLRQIWAAGTSTGRGQEPKVFAPLGNDAVVRGFAPEIEVVTGDWWESFWLPGGLRMTIVPAYHWSSRGLRDRRMALWGGFVMETPAGRVYCAGDTAYRDGVIFREMRERLGAPRVAVLPIGAYAPRWFMRTQHADPAEAMQIAAECGAEEMLGVHWGTFQLTDEPYDEPERLLREAAAGSGLRAGAGVATALRPGAVWDCAGC